LPYCPNLSSLKPTGLDYLDASTSKPSDSFPGLMALVTGGSPRSVGAFYDVAYDRSLDPPAVMTGNGVAGGACTRGTAPTGSTTEFDEGIDFEAPSGVDGGIASIDPQRLDRDPRNGARPFIHGISYVPMRFSAWCTRPEVTRRAPTILQALGLNPQSLQSVAMEGTGLLPGAFQFRH
jgi:hypothetical protein